jgi:hypothetical protein
LKKEYGNKLRGFARGKLNLVPYGNHARGANLLMGATGLLISWKPLSTKCVCKFHSEEWM